mmetsp:Transcript_5410/g.13793  ORF Transcript_5410/g.13793 Transcript_5410/m.13793 type:complete len:235 (+) Transcript_5410:653-1357(+)
MATGTRLRWLRSIARPKLMSFPLPALSSSRLAGRRSRWMTPAGCSSASPRAAWMASSMARAYFRPLFDLLMRDCALPPPRYSIISPRSVGCCKLAPNRRTTFCAVVSRTSTRASTSYCASCGASSSSAGSWSSTLTATMSGPRLALYTLLPLAPLPSSCLPDTMTCSSGYGRSSGTSAASAARSSRLRRKLFCILTMQLSMRMAQMVCITRMLPRPSGCSLASRFRMLSSASSS